MRKVYAYIRVSTVKQGERGSSLLEQRGAIDAYAKRHELEIAEWFEETETAAKQGRRVFNHMLQLLDRKQAAGVIIHKIDRSARNLRDWANLGELIDRGVEVHFAHESVDLKSRGGRLSADIQAVVAADYIRNLRDEVKKGFYGRLKQGYYPLPAPIGYRDNGGGEVKTPDPVTAPLVRKAFELYATGRYNLLLLNDELYDLGLRNRRHGRVSMNGLSTLLHNEFYIGIIRIERTGEHFLGKHEPLISRRLFGAVQDVLCGRKKIQGLKHDFAYRKTLRCTSCGYSLIGERQKGSAYYRCHTPTCRGTSISETMLSSQVHSALSRVRMTSEELDDLIVEFERCDRRTMADRKEMARGLKLRIAQSDERVARLTDAYVDRVIERDIFEERKKQLLQERAALRESLDQMRSNDDPILKRAKEFLELVRRLHESQNLVRDSELRDLLKSTTSNLGIDRKKLLVDWKSPFHLLEKERVIPDGSPQRSIPRTARTQEPGPAKVQDGTPEIPAEHRIKRDISREDNTKVADHILRCVYQKQGDTQPESMKRLAREIHSIFRNEVLGKTNRNSTRALTNDDFSVNF